MGAAAARAPSGDPPIPQERTRQGGARRSPGRRAPASEAPPNQPPVPFKGKGRALCQVLLDQMWRPTERRHRLRAARADQMPSGSGSPAGAVPIGTPTSTGTPAPTQRARAGAAARPAPAQPPRSDQTHHGTELFGAGALQPVDRLRHLGAHAEPLRERMRLRASGSITSSSCAAAASTPSACSSFVPSVWRVRPAARRRALRGAQRREGAGAQGARARCQTQLGHS